MALNELNSVNEKQRVASTRTFSSFPVLPSLAKVISGCPAENSSDYANFVLPVRI